MNSTADFSITDSWTSLWATVIITLNSLLGLYSNISIIHCIATVKHQKTGFNLICLFRSANNTFNLWTACLMVFVPAIVLGSSIYSPMIETVLITTCLNLLVFNQGQGIYLAINRLFAILFPLKYNLFFGNKATLVFHFLFYLFRIINLVRENIDRFKASNYVLFSVEHLVYEGVEFLSDDLFIWAAALLAIPYVINAFTFIRFYFLKKKTSNSSENYRNARRNMRMFVQTVFQDSLFSVCSIFTLKFKDLSNHRFWLFFSHLFLWQSIHVFDGFVMLMFNEKLTMIKKLRGSKITQPELTTKQRDTTIRHPTVIV